MPDQPRTPSPAAQERHTEREILYLLTNPDDNQPVWSIEDLTRELEAFDAIDSVNALHRAGLVNRTSDGHVFATRAAVRHIQIIGRVA